MPRVNPLTADKKIQDNLLKLTRETAHELSDAGISYTEIAELVNKTPQAISQEFRKGRLTLTTWLAAQMRLKGEI